MFKEGKRAEIIINTERKKERKKGGNEERKKEGKEERKNTHFIKRVKCQKS